jgi:hypothetical protein
MTDLSSLTLQPGRVRQVSSLHRDLRGGTWGGLRPAPAKQKRILLEPGETHTLAELSGAGLITRLWLTTFLPGKAHVLQDLTLRCFWDGEREPSVECPLGDFFGAAFGRYTAYVSAPLSLTSGGFTCAFPMPYAAGARLEIRNEGRSVVDPLFFNVTYYELDEPPPSALRFHAQWRRENPTRPGQPYTILEAEGVGQYVGCHVFMQNREWWLRPPLSEIIFPRGVGIGMLEGYERIWIDGEETPSVTGTGAEDFFNAGWYFRGGTFSTPTYGCTVRNYLTARIAAYRFDLNAPTPFRQSLRLTLDHGFQNQVLTDYSSVAYWYQIEPHAPFAPLPPPDGCRPRSPLANVAQALLPLGAPLALGAALWRRSRR